MGRRCLTHVNPALVTRPFRHCLHVFVYLFFQQREYCQKQCGGKTDVAIRVFALKSLARQAVRRANDVLAFGSVVFGAFAVFGAFTIFGAFAVFGAFACAPLVVSAPAFGGAHCSTAESAVCVAACQRPVSEEQLLDGRQ